jgi:hypothetical protein
MMIFNENNLKDEEIKSGFQPGEPDDDSFLLESRGEYPKSFPVFQDAPIEEEVKIDSSEDNIDNQNSVHTSEDEATVSTGSAWDEFENEATPTKIENKNNVSEISDDNNIQDSLLNEVKNADAQSDIEQVIPGVSTSTDEDNGTILLDDDFKAKLAEELKLKDEERAARQAAKMEEDLTEIPPDPNFKPVEEREKKYDFIDLNQINSQEAETTKSIVPPVAVVGEGKSKVKKEKVKKVKEPKANKEKKKKGLIYWFMTIAASLAILTISTYFALNYFIKTPEKKYLDSLTQSHKILQKTPAVAKVDTTKQQLQVQDSSKLDTTRTKAEMTKEDNLNVAVVKENAKSEIKPKERKPDIAQLQPMEKLKIATSPKKESRVPKFSAPRNINNKLRIQKQTKVQKQKENFAQNLTQNESTTKKVAEVYTVQVYSTPSFEDAQIWLQKLYNLNIPSATIYKQKIRDVIWYRIRFGNYPSREEAMNAAKKLGFSQMWVDRVK